MDSETRGSTHYNTWIMAYFLTKYNALTSIRRTNDRNVNEIAKERGRL